MEIEVKEPKAESVVIPATPEEVKEPKKSLKQELRDNYKAAKDKEIPDAKEPEEIAIKPDKKAVDSGDLGKGRIQDSIHAGEPREVKPKEVKPELPAILPPISWKTETKAKWDKLPREIQEEVTRRETEMEKKFSSIDEERQFGRKLRETIAPYTPIINSSGSTPEKAVGELLTYAHILQTGTPQAKAQLLWQLAQRWGADMRITPQAASHPQFQLQELQQKLAKTQEELAGLPQRLQQQQEEAKLKAVIDAFAADPKNPHYERVKAVMASLLSSGGAKDMQDAYDKACYADPDIRSSLLTEQKKAEEEKRIADKKAKAEAARNASSMKSSPGMNGAGILPVVKRSLREELRANFRAATEH